MHALGIDIGSSSVKTAIIDAKTGKSLFVCQHPEEEMPIESPQKSWAEQDPEMWWQAFLKCLDKIKKHQQGILSQVAYIGISYQMHGLVVVDKEQVVIRPSIIWCDSRAVEIGNKAFQSLGADFCLQNLLNSPGNFTASKLKWLKENEPDSYKKIDKIMLPGDYIGMRLSGAINTSISGLSEGVFWDFTKKSPSSELLDNFKIDAELLPEYQENFSVFGTIDTGVAKSTGINKSAIISYKAGDQPNNALSLNVLQPGEIAATAGTSGVVYGVVDTKFVDEKQRVNSFAHVNYSNDIQRIGVLLCINGVGISNAWVKKNFGFESYIEMNESASEILPGSNGLMIFPFGNGAERMLQNKNIDASIEGLNYNIHTKAHFARAVQEGIAFAFAYGMEAFKEKNIQIKKIKAGYANMFLSDLFAQTLADLAGVDIELYDTDGAIGAARGSLVGAGVMTSEEAFKELKKIKVFSARKNHSYIDIYNNWKLILETKLN